MNQFYSRRWFSAGIFIWSMLIVSACTSRPDAQQIINRAIHVHGGERYSRSVTEFDFRQYHYRVSRTQGQFTYERRFTDSTGNQIEDVLTGEEFTRRINGQIAELSPKQRTDYANSVNSVVYFAFLPYKLNDPAVRKRYVGEAVINGVPYHKIEISFAQEGGGKDFQDVFYYWINQRDYTLQHLAYSEGGERFRDAYNPRRINGIRFVDYVNYEKADSLEITPVSRYDSLFEAGRLKELSRIELKNIRVELLPQ
jgi:hypothetical protein